MAHDTTHPEPICFKPAEGREVSLVDAGLNQPGMADRHVDALLNPIGHRRLSPLRDTASAIRSVMSLGVCPRKTLVVIMLTTSEHIGRQCNANRTIAQCALCTSLVSENTQTHS